MNVLDIFQSFDDELSPFIDFEQLGSENPESNIYRIVREDGEVRYVAWGSGTFVPPASITELARATAQTGEDREWFPVEREVELELTNVPIILR